MAQANNDDLANLGFDIIKLLRFLIAVVFISLAIISSTTVMSRRASQTNTRILHLVEDCVVRGKCGPSENPDPSTVKALNYIVDSINCVNLIRPEDRSQEKIENCKVEAAKRVAGG